ncbi:VanZ family protein [Microbacterium marinilacus]|uniref:VanZ family protein n=1 Tax=Microbacterium marinilacus TaxID=415209 RepID=UPI001C8D15E3|nr:VanZ family protein [Microbacterium marinilacus]
MGVGDKMYPAVIAVLAGIAIAVLLFVPFVAGEYRSRGRLPLRRLLLWLGSLVYAMALWTYTLLPLPDPADIRCVAPQLVPGQFVLDILTYDVSSAGALLRNPAVQQVVLNVALFAPMGFLLRALWNRGVVVATSAAFATSLLIEVTQLTGIFGLYGCAYRLFDVDDLLANTVGGLLGALIARLLIRPHGERAVALPDTVTAGRRLLVMLSDAITVLLLGGAAGVGARMAQLWLPGVPDVLRDESVADAAAFAVPFLAVGVVALVTGRTIGDHAVRVAYEPRHSRPVDGMLRYLAGIGGFQLLGLLGGLDGLFALVSLILVFTTRDRRGLPGLLLRRTIHPVR